MDEKIVIKNTQNADSRTANEQITKESLKKDTATHRAEVEGLMWWMGARIMNRGLTHDYTKCLYFDEFAEEVLKPHTDSEFKQANWYQKHIFEERHHLNANCPVDVNLIDVIEMICDCVAAGKGRSGHVTSAFMKLKDPLILERAYWNTVKMLDDITELETEDLEDK